MSHSRGGAAHVDSPEEVLDHFVTAWEWSIPTRYELNPGWALGYELPITTAARKRVHAGPGLLEDFVKLDRAPEEAILAYAQRWGPLWLCKHGTPWRNHVPDCGPGEYFPIEDDWRDKPDDEVTNWYMDDLEGWRRLAAAARATLRIARRVQAGQLVAAEDWEPLEFLEDLLIELLRPLSDEWGFGLMPAPQPEDRGSSASDRQVTRTLYDWVAPPHRREMRDLLARAYHRETWSSDFRGREKLLAAAKARLIESVDLQRRILPNVLNHWLEQGGVKPRMAWDEVGKPAVQLGGWGLIGAIAVQLLFDCSRLDGLAVCTSCGTPYLPPGRRPRRDRNSYCSDCGLKAAARDAAARYRQTAKYKETKRKWLATRRQSGH